MEMTASETAFEKSLRPFGRYFCRRCADKQLAVQAFERSSMGVYAGMLCDDCWDKDDRNHDREFDPTDAGERMDPED